MKQLQLLSVPKESPSIKERIAAFKKENRIFTHCSTMVEDKWSALLVPPDVEDGKEVEYISGYCCVLDEAGRLVVGKTEREAIRALCENMDIKCDL